MPTVLRDGPYRLFFYSGDAHEAPHVHVERDDDVAKFWLSPVRLARSGGFGGTELSRIQRIVEAHAEALRRAWHEHFGG